MRTKDEVLKKLQEVTELYQEYDFTCRRFKTRTAERRIRAIAETTAPGVGNVNIPPQAFPT